jgi:hypothetical protein
MALSRESVKAIEATIKDSLMDKSIRHRTNSVVAIALQKSIFENA